MKKFLRTTSVFLTAFIITAIVIAAIAAIATLGGEDKVLYLDFQTQTLHIFGKEYIASPKFVNAASALFDCNEVFFGKRAAGLIKEMLIFPTHYVGNALGLMFGIFEGMIKNSV